MATYAPANAATLPVGYNGMIANGETSNRISRVVEDVAGIGFGRPVFRGTNDDGITATAGGQFYGFTIADKTSFGFVANGGAQATTDAYARYATAGVLTQGVMWINSIAAVADGGQVYYAANGDVTGSSTSTTAAAGWFFQDTTSAAGLVRIAKR